MFPKEQFDTFDYEPDMWASHFPVLKLDDLQPKQDTPIRMSFLIGFTESRKTQLAISLECLARQTFKDFEVLICDDGSRPQGMEDVYDMFHPYLHIKTIRLERAAFSACLSRSIKALLPLAQGEILVAMAPEMMLVHEAADYLYNTHFRHIPADVFTYYVNMDRKPTFIDLEKPRDENVPRWVCFKTGFLNYNNQANLHTVDWHSDTSAVETLPQFWYHHDCLSAMTNMRVLEYNHWPWWFLCSMKATNSIWKDMPHTVGHASIDFYFLNYRAIKGYIDVCAKPLMGYHQFHSHSRSCSPIGEQESVSAESLKKNLGI